jgi:arsenate reductase
METNKNQVTIYYKPEIKKDINTYNLAKQLSEHINDINVMKDMPNERQLIEILDRLNRKPSDLVDKDSHSYKAKFENHDFDDMDWLKTLVANPDMLYTPIVFYGDRGMIVDTPSRVLDLDPSHGTNDLKT